MIFFGSRDQYRQGRAEVEGRELDQDREGVRQREEEVRISPSSTTWLTTASVIAR